MSRFHLLTTALAAALLLWAMAGREWLSPTAPVLAVALYLAVTAMGVTFPSWQFFGPYRCRGHAAGRQVAITFDDGPDPDSTPALLDVLAESGTPAAFFVVGAKVRAYPELASRMAREGHVVANHSFGHHPLTNFFSARRLWADIEATQRAIEDATGVRPTLFRPPMGLTNPRVFRALRRARLQAIGWTARGMDTPRRSPEAVVSRINRGLKPGAIILLHEGKHDIAAQARLVRMLLDKLRALGYQPVRLDALLAVDDDHK